MNFKKATTIVLLFCLISMGILFKQIPDDRFHIYFLDVGQGDATFIKTPLNHQILIDGGPENLVIEELGKVMPFFDKTIDLVVLTHPHADHIDGLVEVLKRFEVENIVINGIYSHESSYLEFLDQLTDEVSVFIADDETDFSFGEVYIDVVYPIESFYGKSFDNINNSSVSVQVIYKNTSILITGDLEAEGEMELVDISDVDIYQAGHHGSKTASSLEFLARINPDIVVVSCGEDNQFDHPHTEALNNFELVGAKSIFRTDQEGTIEFVF